MSSITPFDVVKVNGVKVRNKKVDDRYLSQSITRMFASWKFSKRGMILIEIMHALQSAAD